MHLEVRFGHDETVEACVVSTGYDRERVGRTGADYEEVD
jgi:hypothetical protein